MSNLQSRSVCKYNEEYTQPLLDNIYRMLNIHTERVYDISRQTKGADVIFRKGPEFMALDEKVSTSKQLYIPNGRDYVEQSRRSRDAYGMELSYRNRRNDITKGWFHPDERSKAINSGYVITWINSEKEERDCADYGKLRKINQIEICVVPYDKLREIVNKALDGKTIDEKVSEIYEDIEKTDSIDKHRIYQSSLSDRGVRFSYSGNINGQPINCIIPKEILRELSFINYGFNLTGELGHERPIEFINLKDETNQGRFKPMRELYYDTQKNPIGFPRPRYLSLEDKKERILASMGLPSKAFSMFVPHRYICEHSLDFLKHSETSEQALEKMVAHCVDETGMVNSKYFPIIMGISAEKSDDLSTNTKRKMLVDAVLQDHDKLSEIYTIKALENWNYEPDRILKATSKVLPNNLVGLEERINKAADYIEYQQQKGVREYVPKRDNQDRSFEIENKKGLNCPGGRD